MIERSYEFGGVVFRFRSPKPLLRHPQMEEFAVENREADYIFEISTKSEPKPPVSWRREGHTVFVQIQEDLLEKNSIKAYLTAANGAGLLVEQGRFILHASFVLHKGEAILFSAPSGTGKSTQAAFWKQCRGAVTVNEDRVILKKQDGVYYACGCWASGKSADTHNVTAPVRAIVLLEQGEKNQVLHKSMLEKLQLLLRECTFDEARQGSQIMNLAADVLAAVPVIAYGCLNDPSAVEELESYL